MPEEAERLVKIPYDVTSAVTPREATALAGLCRDRVILELGSYHGFSTVVIASVAEKVVAVDWHRGDDMAGISDTWDIFWTTLCRYGVADRVKPVKDRFETALPRMLANADLFDGCFLDGHHSATSVAADLSLVLPLIRAGGFLAFHDYGRGPENGHPGFGVTAVVDDLHLARFGRTGYLAWGYLPGDEVKND